MELAETQTTQHSKRNTITRDQLITTYLPYVKRLVNRIAIHLPPSVDSEDLLHVGVIGLIQAIERYDSSRDNKFTTYAAFRIRGAILSELRSRDFLSRSSRRKIREMEMAYLKLEQKFGREVEDDEVAEEMGITLEQYYRIKQMSSISFISLEELGYNFKKDHDSLISSLFQSDDEDVLTLAGFKELKAGLAEAIEELPEKEKLVISLYYMDELTMKETGQVLGITESRVSQLHSRAIIHLRAKLRKKKLIDG